MTRSVRRIFPTSDRSAYFHHYHVLSTQNFNPPLDTIHYRTHQKNQIYKYSYLQGRLNSSYYFKEILIFINQNLSLEVWNGRWARDQ